MLLPTPTSKHFFNVSGNDELRDKLKLWIRQNYSDILGPEINLLDLPNGFDLLENKLHRLMSEKGMKPSARAAVAA